MNRLVLFCLFAVAGCGREDGRPDPPVQHLVPCDRDAGPDAPLACPSSDAGVRQDGGD